MAVERLTRTLSADLSVRSDGRTIFGVVAPFDRAATVNDGFGPYSEMFSRGAFERTIAERGGKVKLLVNHDRLTVPIGKAVLLREDAAGLYGEFRVSNTERGDEALELARDGALDAFSVGFLPVRHRENRDGSVVRSEVRLDEVSLVAFPAYEGAVLAGVRSADPHLSIADARARLDSLTRNIR